MATASETFVRDNRIHKPDLIGGCDQFTHNFNRFTNDILDEMDWDNVLVSGTICVKTLLSFGLSVDDLDNYILAHDEDYIDIYIYGLTPSQANTKLQHIYDIWSSNLPDDKDIIVTKHVKIIEYVAQHPHRRLRIFLRLYKSRAEILSSPNSASFPTLGFDGSTVYMLPSTARALETGFKVRKTCSCGQNIYAFPQHHQHWDTMASPSREIRDAYGRMNYALFNENMKQVIAQKLVLTGAQLAGNNVGGLFPAGAFVGYLTGQARPQIHGDDLASVISQRNTLPLLIPHELETHIEGLLGDPSKSLLRPVYNKDAHGANAVRPAVINALPDTTSEEGNLRYFINSRRRMWQGRDAVVDSISDVLWELFHTFKTIASFDNSWLCDNPETIRIVARQIYDRLRADLHVEKGVIVIMSHR